MTNNPRSAAAISDGIPKLEAAPLELVAAGLAFTAVAWSAAVGLPRGC